MRQRRRSLLTALLAVLVVLSTVAPVLAQQREIHGLNPAAMDLSADPSADFYRFANGGWLDRTTIPADEGAYGVFQELDDRTTQQLLDLLNGLAAGSEPREGTDEWKAARFFQQGTDLATRNAQGIAPVQPILDTIDGISDLEAFHAFHQDALFLYLSGLFSPWVYPDFSDSSVNAVYLFGPFLGLPNRDYYLEDDAANEEVRAAYIATAATLLTYAGYDQTRAEAAAQAVYDLERALAVPTLTREEEQDFSLMNNPTAIADLATEYPLIDWNAYLETLGLAGIEEIIVTQPRYLPALVDIVNRTPLVTLKDYYTLEVLWSFAPRLSEEIATTAFEFQGKVLAGAEEQAPLAERVLDDLNYGLGEALGRLYVARHFPPEAKAQITTLVEDLQLAFRGRLEANPWMSPETRAKALEKLDKISLKVGYPDRWRSYEAVEIADSFAETFLSANAADARRVLDQAGKPVDRGEWFAPPQVVNAFYSPENNELLFPAAILQPPFFDYRADPGSNFGAIGAVIGHEITHGFDLQGSQFDAAGNLVNWWTDEDYERFQVLNDRVATQYGAEEILPDLFVDGQITVTENVADLGGVQVAFDALRLHLATSGAPLPPPPSTMAAAGPRLSQEQRFFVAWATVWREKARDEYLTTLVKADPHSPAAIRGTLPIRNMDAFFDAFDIRPGDPMYLPPEERVIVW